MDHIPDEDMPAVARDPVQPGLVNVCHWRTIRPPVRKLIYGGVGCQPLALPAKVPASTPGTRHGKSQR